MKKKIFTIIILIFSSGLFAQGLYNNGAKIVIGAGTYLTINGTTGGYLNATNVSDGAIALDGTLKLGGDYTNNVAAADILVSVGAAGEVEFAGTGPQNLISTSGAAFGFNNLNINNASGVNLLHDATVNGLLKLTTGLFDIGNSNLGLGAAALFSGTPSSLNMIVATGTGELRKLFTATGAFTFPVGDNTGTAEYSPVTLDLTAGTFAPGAYAGVNLVNTKYGNPGISGSYLDRYWNVSQSGVSTFLCDALFQYVPGDVVGTEALIEGARVSPLPVTFYTPVNTTTHQFTASGINAFGTFTGSKSSPDITGPTDVCESSTGNTYTTDPGQTGYNWLVSAGGTVTSGGTATDDFVVITWNTPGPQTVTTSNFSFPTPAVLNVTVNPLPIVTLDPAGPFCADDPAFQLNGLPVNGTYSGTGVSASGLFTPSVAGDFVITYTFTNTFGCSASASTTITVNPLLPVSVSIAASASAVCANTTVTFTATPTNEGTAPVYQWKVNNVNAGTNSTTFSYIPMNNDVVTCELTSNITPCARGNPATSNAVTITVYPQLQTTINGVTVTDNNDGTNDLGAFAVCNSAANNIFITQVADLQGSTPANLVKVIQQFTRTNVNFSSSNGVAPISYYANGFSRNVSLVNTAQPGTLVMSYRIFFDSNNNNIIDGTECAGDLIVYTVTVNSILPVSISIAPDANPVCEGTSVTFTATPVNEGITPAYQWKVNNVNAGTNSPTFTYTPANNDAVNCVLTSINSCATGNPAISNLVTMTVNPVLTAGVSVAADATPVCDGTAVTFTATPTNGGTTPAYQWYNGASPVGTNSPTYAYVPANGDAITVAMTSMDPCTLNNPATSNTVMMTVNPILPVSVSISATATTVCVFTAVTFTATPTNGGTTPVYQWKVNNVNAGTNSATYTYSPVNNDIVKCVLTSNITPCATGNPATSNSITMTVNPFPQLQVTLNGVTVTDNHNGIDDVGAFAVCNTNTYNIFFTHFVDLVGVTPTSLVKVRQEVTLTNVTFNLGAGTNPIAGYPQTFNRIVKLVNGAQPGTLVVNWRIWFDINNNNVIDGSECAGDWIVYTISVNPVIPASISISASSNPACAGTPVTYTALPVNGGTTPVYQWKVNNVNAGTNSSTFNYTPLNGDVISCTLTSSNSCATGNPATSNSVNMAVNPSLTASVSNTADANPVCAGTTVTFTATPTNGGTTPAYQWYKGASPVGTDSPTYSYIPANGDVISVVMTSNITGCLFGSPATSNSVTLTVNPVLTASASIAADANPVCAGTTVTFTATPVNGGTTPAYQWYNGANPVGTNSATYSYIPNNGDVISAVITSNASPCLSGSPATSNSVTMTVNPILTASVSIAADANPVCDGTTVTFTATPTNGGTTPAYQWYNGVTAVGTNSPTYAYVPANGDVISVVMTSNATPCLNGSPATSNSVTVSIIPILTASVSIAADANPVCAGTTVTFTATPTNGGTTPAYQWYNGATAVGTNSATYAYVPANGDLIKVVMTSNATPCLSGSPATSNQVSMTVNPNLPVSLSISASATTVCAFTPVTYTATPTNGGTTPAYQWKVNNVNAGTNSAIYIYTPANNDVVTCVLTSDTAPCATGNPATSNSITMTVISRPQLRITLNGLTVTDNHDGVDDPGAFAVCNTNTYNIFFTQFVDLMGVTPTSLVKVRQEVTLTNVTFNLGTGTNPITGYPQTFNRIVKLVNPALPGTLVVRWRAWFDINNNNIVDANECVGDWIVYTIMVNSGNPASAGAIAGSATFSQGTVGNPYSVAAITNATSYVWSYTGTGVTINKPANPLLAYAVTLDFGATATAGTLSVYGQNGCGNGAASNLNLSLLVKSVAIEWPTIKLETAGANETSSTLITFNSEMTRGLDPDYDISISNSDSDLLVYSRLVEDDGIPYAVQALPDNDYGSLVIPIGLDYRTGGDIVFSAESTNLSADCKVLLEDKLFKPFTDLSDNVYKVNILPNSLIPDRFLLHTSYMATGISENTNMVSPLSAYAIRNTEIRVKGEVSSQAVAMLYDLQGRMILMKNLEAGSLNIIRTPELHNGIYILFVKDQERVERFKLPVKE